MALNLSTLTSPATSGDVLAEVLTTADFLEPVPVLRNLATGSKKGGDAKQDVALNQPKALPLIDGDGYLYASGVSGNYGEADSPILPSTGDFDLTIDFVWKDTAFNNQDLFAQYDFSFIGRFFIYITPDGALNTFWNGGSDHQSGAAGSIIEGRRHVARFNRTGNTFAVYLDGVSYYSYTVGSTVPIAQVDSTIGNGSTTRTAQHFKGAIFSVTEGSNTNIDFTATNVRHGDTKFRCATGQVVTINQAGNDPATVIKKPVLRFDGTNDGLQGLFGQTITDGYMFAAFSVLGDGGESFGRVFTLNSAGASDADAESYIPAYKYLNSINGFSGATGSNTMSHDGLYSSENGDILNEHKFTASSQLGKVNGADVKTNTANLSSVSIEEFNICFDQDQTRSVSVDLEYLALFPADSVPDEATATKIRNYINKRNNVFDLKDGFGYYFYDAQKAPVGNITDVNTWSGRIVGSDNGDSASIVAQQATANDQPVSDGYVVTFADNTDHLDIPSTTQAGWQVVGTSLGTFVYKVNNTAVTELNLLGNLGDAAQRKTGDLYGVILLPESATGKDIEEARKLLIDRGAADGVIASSVESFWRSRADIVEFSRVDFTGVSNVRFGWNSCSAMTNFNVGSLPDATNVYNAFRSSGLTVFNTDLPSAVRVDFAWKSCASLASFGPVDIPNCTNFTSAWQGCSSLTSFPADAKLGTEANNVNFRAHGSQVDLLRLALRCRLRLTQVTHGMNCTSLTSFSSELPSVTNALSAW
jgi:hypothetical protein